MNSKTFRRTVLAALASACLLLPFFTPANPGPGQQPDLSDYTEVYDTCARSSDDWDKVWECVETVCDIFECDYYPDSESTG